MRLITIKPLKYYPTGVAIFGVEKLHWQMVAINTAISGGKKVPMYHVIW